MNINANITDNKTKGVMTKQRTSVAGVPRSTHEAVLVAESNRESGHEGGAQGKSGVGNILVLLEEVGMNVPRVVDDLLPISRQGLELRVVVVRGLIGSWRHKEVLQGRALSSSEVGVGVLASQRCFANLLGINGRGFGGSLVRLVELGQLHIVGQGTRKSQHEHNDEQGGKHFPLLSALVLDDNQNKCVFMTTNVCPKQLPLSQHSLSVFGWLKPKPLLAVITWWITFNVEVRLFELFG
jgi:hypothetical protein